MLSDSSFVSPSTQDLLDLGHIQDSRSVPVSDVRDIARTTSVRVSTLLVGTKVTLLSTTRKLIYLNKEFAAL